MGLGNYRLVLWWYLLPMLYLLLVERVFLFHSSMILLVFLAALTAGFIAAGKSRVAAEKSYPVLDTFFNWVIILTVIVQLYGFYRVLVDGFDLTRYRMDFYEVTGGIFRSTYLYTLYTVFLMPLFLIGVMYLLNKDLSAKSVRRLVIFCFTIIVLDGILRLGRFQYLYVLFFFYLSYKAFGFRRVAFIVLAFAAVIISFLTIYLRQFFVDSAVESALDIANAEVFRNSVVSYQYNGYIFLDELVKEKSIFGAPWEFNTGSFLFLFSKTLTTKIGMDFNYAWEQYNLVLTEGMYHRELDLVFNAFSTNFLPVYLDLGFIGIFLYGFFSGIFIGFKSKNILVRTLQYLNLFVLIFGLYQPVITFLPGFILLVAFAGFILYAVRLYGFSRRGKLRDPGPTPAQL